MRKRLLLAHSFETFHEIIYGKSERGAKECRVFFCPYHNFARPLSDGRAEVVFRNFDALRRAASD
jgi:hypothetical protein